MAATYHLQRPHSRRWTPKRSHVTQRSGRLLIQILRGCFPAPSSFIPLYRILVHRIKPSIQPLFRSFYDPGGFSFRWLHLRFQRQPRSLIQTTGHLGGPHIRQWGAYYHHVSLCLYCYHHEQVWGQWFPLEVLLRFTSCLRFVRSRSRGSSGVFNYSPRWDHLFSLLLLVSTDSQRQATPTTPFGRCRSCRRECASANG